MRIYPEIVCFLLILFTACGKEEESIRDIFDITITETSYDSDCDAKLYDFIIDQDLSVLVAYNGVGSPIDVNEVIIDSTIIHLEKISSQGERVWKKTYPTDRQSKVFDIIQSIDGGFFLLGTIHATSNQETGGHSILLIKLDNQGEVLWQREYAATNNSRGYEMVQKNNGDIVILGEEYVEVLIELDSQGNLKKSISLSGRSARILCANMGLCLGSDETVVFSGGGMIGFREGKKIWDFIYNTSDLPFGSGLSSVCPIIEGGYMGFGFRINYETEEPFDHIDFLLVRVDPDGQVVWEKTIDNEAQDWGYDINPSEDGNFVAIGQSFDGLNPGTGQFIRAYKFDPDGNILWQKRILPQASTHLLEPCSIKPIGEDYVGIMYTDLKLREIQFVNQIKFSKIRLQ